MRCLVDVLVFAFADFVAAAVVVVNVVVAPAMRLLKMLHLLSARRFVGNAFPF